MSPKTQGKEDPECWLILFAQVLENKNLFQILAYTCSCIEGDYLRFLKNMFLVASFVFNFYNSTLRIHKPSSIQGRNQRFD